MACAGARDTSVPSLEKKQPASTDRPLGEGMAKGHLLAATWVCSLRWPSSLWLALVLLANIGVWKWGGSQSEGGDNESTNSGSTHPCCLRHSVPCSRGPHHLPSHWIGGATLITYLSQGVHPGLDICPIKRPVHVSQSYSYGHGQGWALVLGA